MCAGALPAGQLLCVTKAGDFACPDGYAKKFPVGTATTARQSAMWHMHMHAGHRVQWADAGALHGRRVHGCRSRRPRERLVHRRRGRRQLRLLSLHRQGARVPTLGAPPPGRWSDHRGTEDRLLRIEELTAAANEFDGSTCARHRYSVRRVATFDLSEEGEARTGIGVARSRRLRARARRCARREVPRRAARRRRRHGTSPRCDAPRPGARGRDQRSCSRRRRTRATPSSAFSARRAPR